MSQETTPEPRIVLVTAPSEDAAGKLARGMVEERLAACVNLVTGVKSVFRWEDAIQEESELLMIVKTTDARLEKLVAFVEREHPYDVPEFVVIDPEAIEHGYREWLLDECVDPTAKSE